MATGIYKMMFIGTDKFYIGSTAISFDHRWYRHILDLKARRHKNRIVQNYYNKYGEPKFEVLEEIERFDSPEFKIILLKKEQHYLDSLKPKLNVCPTAGSNLGKYYPPFSDEHKRKIGIAGIGRVATVETRRKIGEGHKGKIISKEARGKMSKSHTGKILTEEHIKNIGLASKGRKMPPFTDEHKRNIGKAGRGRIPWNKGIPRSEEAKRKMSESLKGKSAWNKGISCTEETKRKMSESLKGKSAWNKGIPCTEETKKKISGTKRRNKLKL